MEIQWITIGISILALIFSLTSLWKNYLAPFKLKVCHDSPTFSLYKITPKISGGRKTWWIPSIDMGFTVHNLGCKSGEVTDIRLLTKLKSKNYEKKYTFYAKWIVNFVKFKKKETSRFEWIHDSIEREWYPLILAGNEQKSIHIVFEGGRWDKKFIGTLSLCLQIFSSQKKKWIECNRYNHFINEDMNEKNEKYTLSDNKLEKIRKINDNWDDSYKFSRH
jgi:hypothetical protein